MKQNNVKNPEKALHVIEHRNMCVKNTGHSERCENEPIGAQLNESSGVSNVRGNTSQKTNVSEKERSSEYNKYKSSDTKTKNEEYRLRKDKHRTHSDKHDANAYESESLTKKIELENTLYNNTKKYSKNDERGKNQFVFFYGMNSPFSLFHPATFEVDGVTYNCAAQYMMHQKADDRIARQILMETKPLKQKRLGRKVSNFDPNIWNQHCQGIVIKGNMAKFSQNPRLEKQLIHTYPKTLAESSPRDCLWGIGLGENNPKAWNVNTWRGKNLLGKALMAVRNHLMTAKKMLK